MKYRLSDDKITVNFIKQRLVDNDGYCPSVMDSYGNESYKCPCDDFIKNVKKEPILICFTTTIVSYMCHNFFCYQTVCCTPFVFILIGIGAYICRKSKDNN